MSPWGIPEYGVSPYGDPSGVTSGDIILTALKLMGIEEAGETSTSEDLQDGLTYLNLLIDEWSIDRSKVYARVEDTLVLDTSKSVYTFGIDPSAAVIADLQTDTPMSVEQGFLRNLELTPNLDYPLNVTMLQETYNSLPIKTIQTIPTRLFVQKSFPLFTLYFDYIPNLAYELHLFSWKPLSFAPELQTVLAFPRGYASALTYNLAANFCSAFGKQVPVKVEQLAERTARALGVKNHEIPKSKLQGFLKGDGTGSIFNPFVRG